MRGTPAKKAPPSAWGAAPAGTPRWSAVAAGPTSPAGPTAAAEVHDDPALEWALQESRREHAQKQERIAAEHSGARVEKGEIVVPNVGSKLPLAELHAELHHLAALYAAMRRVRGDGNCFYRALWMGWMERLCALPLAEREAVWLRLVPRLKTELEGGVPEKRRSEWAALSDGFATTTETLCAGGAGDAAAAALLTPLEGSETATTEDVQNAVADAAATALVDAMAALKEAQAAVAAAEEPIDIQSVSESERRLQEVEMEEPIQAPTPREQEDEPIQAPTPREPEDAEPEIVTPAITRRRLRGGGGGESWWARLVLS